MGNIAYDGQLQSIQAPLNRPHRQSIKESLRWMLVHSIPGIDD
jgi:hypothetical protein